MTRAAVEAWRVVDTGHPEAVLRREFVEVPAPAEGEVELAVQTVGLNFVDVLIAEGKYQEQPGRPYTPGIEAFAIVTAVGSGVTGVSVGETVVAAPYVPGGVLARRAICPQRLCYPVPAGTDPIKGAALVNSYITAVLALERRAALKSGETVLVHAGAGSVGSAAIQVAKALGARVIATAGGPEKVEICRRLGVEAAFDYTAEDFTGPVKELTGGRGADVVFDPVGGAAFERSRRCVALEGRILVIGFASGEIPSLLLNHPLLKLYSVVGSAIGVYRDAMPDVWRGGIDRVMELFANGAVDPLVSSVIGFDEVPEGYRRLRSRSTWGKVVVRI